MHINQIVFPKKLINKAFSLIEVLVFTAVLGIFFVAAITVTTFNLKNMKIQEHKILATRYAEEGMEWVRQEKEDDWTIFITSDTGGGTTYCINDLNWNNPVPSTCPSNISGTIYKREVFVKNTYIAGTVNQVDATVTVSWADMGTTLSVQVKTTFKLLE